MEQYEKMEKIGEGTYGKVGAHAQYPMQALARSTDTEFHHRYTKPRTSLLES